MIEFIAHVLLSTALLLVVANAIDGVDIQGWTSAIIGALVLGLVNAFVRPLMIVLTLPLTVLTFGLFLLVVNALMLWLMATVVPGIRVRSFGPALWGSLLLTVLNIGVSLLIGPGWTV